MDRIIGYCLTSLALLCAIAILASDNLYVFYPLALLAFGSLFGGYRIPLYITLILAFPLVWCWLAGV